MKNTLLVAMILSVSILFGCQFSEQKKIEYPKNIILLIGDGMGLAQITAAKTAAGNLNMEKLEVVGLATTHAARQYVTDSAAGATAMATGVKTYNGAIAVSVDSINLKTSFEYAEEKNMATGLVSTSGIVHATPAAFAAHQDYRLKYPEIAEDMSKSGVDVLIGGGKEYFIPQSEKDSRRKDEKNLLENFDAETKFAFSVSALDSIDNSNSNVIALLKPGHLSKASERDYSLAKLTEKAIAFLSNNQNGFILMVEGSQIDWSGHGNDIDGIIQETIDFDEAVGVALQFASENKNTLVIVTADHETGGLALEGGSIESKKVGEVNFTTKGHTAVMVPVFASGPGAQYFGGIIDNTVIGNKTIEFINRR